MIQVRRRIADDGGMALVEFIGIAIVLMIPLIYLASIVALVGRATVAADAGARAATRIFVVSATEASARKNAKAVLGRVVADHGLSNATTKMSLTCASKPCLTLGSVVTISVAITQPLDGLPTLGIVPRSVTSTSSHSMVVEEMRK